VEVRVHLLVVGWGGCVFCLWDCGGGAGVVGSLAPALPVLRMTSSTGRFMVLTDCASAKENDHGP